MTTTATASTTTTTAAANDGNRTTSTTTWPQANEDSVIDTQHGHEICPNPLPWSPHQYFQGPMCGCHDSDWTRQGTTGNDQNETNAS